jgi:hypothetical protein
LLCVLVPVVQRKPALTGRIEWFFWASLWPIIIAGDSFVKRFSVTPGVLDGFPNSAAGAVDN